MRLNNTGKKTDESAVYFEESSVYLCTKCAYKSIRLNGFLPDDECRTIREVVGTYKVYGLEVDNPAHCDVCGILLPCSLTTDGEDYVKKACTEGKQNSVTRLWRRVFYWIFDE